MKAIKLLATSALLMGSAVLVAPGIAAEIDKTAQGYHHMGKSGHHHSKGDKQYTGHVGRMAHVLGLTDTQKETLKSQREADKTTRVALQGQIKNARLALNSAVEAGANEAELNALAEALGSAQAQQALAAAKNHQAFLAVLTEEQKQTLVELKSKRMERKGFRKESREPKDV